MKFNVGRGVVYHSLRVSETVAMVGWGHVIKGLVNRLRSLDLPVIVLFKSFQSIQSMYPTVNWETSKKWLTG